jgi:hypothetical protein
MAWESESERHKLSSLGIKTVMYHGTRQGNFDQFIPHYRRNEQLGFGIHFTPDESFANRYAYDDATAHKGRNPYVHKVELLMNNTLDANQIVYEGTPEFELAKKLAGQKFRCFSSKDERGIPGVYLQSCIDATNPKRAEKIIREIGYDSVKYNAKILNHSGNVGYAGQIPVNLIAEAPTYIVFSPSQIKKTQ